MGHDFRVAATRHENRHKDPDCAAKQKVSNLWYPWSGMCTNGPNHGALATSVSTVPRRHWCGYQANLLRFLGVAATFVAAFTTCAMEVALTTYSPQKRPTNNKI